MQVQGGQSHFSRYGKTGSYRKCPKLPSTMRLMNTRAGVIQPTSTSSHLMTVQTLIIHFTDRHWCQPCTHTPLGLGTKWRSQCVFIQCKRRAHRQNAMNAAVSAVRARQRREGCSQQRGSSNSGTSSPGSGAGMEASGMSSRSTDRKGPEASGSWESSNAKCEDAGVTTLEGALRGREEGAPQQLEQLKFREEQ